MRPGPPPKPWWSPNIKVSDKLNGGAPGRETAGTFGVIDCSAVLADDVEAVDTGLSLEILLFLYGAPAGPGKGKDFSTGPKTKPKRNNGDHPHAAWEVGDIPFAWNPTANKFGPVAKARAAICVNTFCKE